MSLLSANRSVGCWTKTYSSRLALLFYACSASAMSTSTGRNRIIDSHLHVWADSLESSRDGFPYAVDPPDSLRDRASTSALLKKMDASGVDGALIVQPINHKFDHSYVEQAIKSHPDRFKGMLLHDPSLDTEKSLSKLEELAKRGFVGVRFNPYLWPKLSVEGSDTFSPMSQGSGLAVYKRCGELGMPVGIMCFQGLELHYDDILELLNASPETTMILDHFGFTSVDKPAVFARLLELAKYPQVVVKTSAVFRLGDVSADFARVHKERFLPLLEEFGADRLMFGSDFPFCLEELPEGYNAAKQFISSWTQNPFHRTAILGGTAERAFGKWGSRDKTS